MLLVLRSEEPDLAVAGAEPHDSQCSSPPAFEVSSPLGPRKRSFYKVEVEHPRRMLKPHLHLSCVLFLRGAAPSQVFEIADLGLRVRTHQLVRFQAYSSTSNGGEPGRRRSLAPMVQRQVFHPLPALPDNHRDRPKPPPAGNEWGLRPSA